MRFVIVGLYVILGCALLLLLVGVVGFFTALTDREKTGTDTFISTFHDPDWMVTCWVYKQGYAGGISCIPDQELVLR